MTERGIINSFRNGDGKGKGFGFITRPGLADLFVHIEDFHGAGPRELHTGDQVSFEIAPGRAGRPRAKNVRVNIRAEQTETDWTPRRHD
jgi:cold shock CspA family protein